MQYKVIETKEENKDFFRKLYTAAPLMQRLSLFALSCINRNIDNGIKPENAPLTREVKQGSQTLRDRNLLQNSLHARHSNTDAIVASSHIAASLNHPEDNINSFTIRPKNAKYLTIPATPRIRTFQRRYGFSPREVIAGLRNDKWNVYRPLKNKRPLNVILANKKKETILLFILKRSVTVPVRRFMFLTENDLSEVDSITENYFK